MILGLVSTLGCSKSVHELIYDADCVMLGPPECIAAQKTLTHVVDNILIGKNSSDLTLQLKTAFGLENIT